jgi:uncharacterized protein
MRKWLKRIGLAFLAITTLIVGLALYSYHVGARDFVVVEETLTVPNWSSGLDGFKIVAVSDIHSGSNYAPEERLRYMVEQVNAQNADIVVLLGDYVSESKLDRRRINLPEGETGSELRMPVEQFAEIFGGMRARYGVFAVIGNHDNWHNGRKITNELERYGINVLENETAQVTVEGETVRLWGIEDLWKNRRVPLDPFSRLAEKRNVIALTHNPDSVLQMPPGFSILFAGHSHGGQFNWPLFGPIAAVNDGRFMDGHAVVDGKHVYVTSGVGTSVIPFRFRVPPEIAVITLRSN